MGLRGAAPKPLELVRLEGNPNHQKINIETPRFKPILAPCPSWLDSGARKEWRRIGPELERLGLMTSADMACFASYCSSYSRLMAAQKVLKRLGLTFETPNGYVMPRPEVAISNAAMKMVKDFAIQFGFTPSARGRIQLPNHGDGTEEDLD
jgi:P27 family predicted phage terminase small subunit